MNIHQLKQFVCVARHRNISKAAAELFMTQQALSKAMRLLQAEVCDELFIQTQNGLLLTSFGNKLFSISLSLIQFYDNCMDMIDRLVEKNRSHLTVIYEHPVFQYAVPKGLSEKYNVTFSLAQGMDICLEQVRTGKADLALCNLPSDLSGLRYFRIISEPLMFMMNKNHPLAQKELLTLQDIRDVPQNISPPFTNIMLKFIDACINEGFYPNFEFESQDIGVLISSLLSTDRIQLCASCDQTDLGGDQLAIVPLNHKTLWRDMGFIVRSGHENAQIFQFIESVQEYYKARTVL